MLTGRNHHSVGMGRITDLATGFPGYDASISPRHGFLPAMLTPVRVGGLRRREVAPDAPRTSNTSAPTDRRWPLGRGFERYYGFFDGETHQFAPNLFHDNHQDPVPRTMDEGYHLTTDLVDHAIEQITDLRNADPDKPFFLYVTPGACHSPHQAPPEYLERYRGRFDAGWDEWRERCFARQKALGVIPETTELSPRPDWVPAWADLSEDERRVYARLHGGLRRPCSPTPTSRSGAWSTSSTRPGDLDDTVFMVLSDNGASSEGGVGGSLNDVRRWNGLGTSPAREPSSASTRSADRPSTTTTRGAGPSPATRRTDAGSARCTRAAWPTRCIVHWPAGISDPGALRHQYCHAIDITPTVLELCGVDAPAVLKGVPQSAIEGVSLAPVLAHGDHPEVRTVQYFEMFGCRALYRDGHKAVTFQPIQVDEPRPDDEHWELYDVRVDPSECHDLAVEHAGSAGARWSRSGGTRPRPTTSSRSTTARSVSSPSPDPARRPPSTASCCAPVRG